MGKAITLKETDMIRTMPQKTIARKTMARKTVAQKTMTQKTIQTTVRTFCLIALLVSASVALAQTEFSGEMFDAQKGSNGKIYFSKDKVRFESANKDPRSGGVVILNLATQTTTVLMNQQHMYMDLSPQMASQRMTYNFFRTGDVEAACSDWMQLPQKKGGSCHKIGSETVNGRSTVKYEGTNAKGETGDIWLDPKLRFPVKWEGRNGNWELRNIQEGSQPASLFEVPAGYTKFEMGGMMQRPQ
jgi:hypothetical protein